MILLDINIWWAALPTLQKVYWIIAVPSTIVFLIQLILLFVGGDSDTDIDIDDISLEHGAGMDIFSVKSIVSFLMFFGWSGLAAAEGGLNAFGALLISFTAGLIMMLLTAWLFMMLIRLQANGIMKTETAIGSSGEVYLTIPPKKTGSGKVQIVVQGTLRTLDAVTDADRSIKTGETVDIIDTEGGVLIVLPRN